MFKRNYCVNNVALPSFAFCGNDAAIITTITIVSATCPDLTIVLVPVEILG